VIGLVGIVPDGYPPLAGPNDRDAVFVGKETASLKPPKNCSTGASTWLARRCTTGGASRERPAPARAAVSPRFRECGRSGTRRQRGTLVATPVDAGRCRSRTLSSALAAVSRVGLKRQLEHAGGRRARFAWTLGPTEWASARPIHTIHSDRASDPAAAAVSRVDLWVHALVVARDAELPACRLTAGGAAGTYDASADRVGAAATADRVGAAAPTDRAGAAAATDRAGAAAATDRAGASLVDKARAIPAPNREQRSAENGSKSPHYSSFAKA
jgi:hypothetical protein